jgi:hypothetical protein
VSLPFEGAGVIWRAIDSADEVRCDAVGPGGDLAMRRGGAPSGRRRGPLASVRASGAVRRTDDYSPPGLLAPSRAPIVAGDSRLSLPLWRLPGESTRC